MPLTKSEQKPEYRWTFEALGTSWEVVSSSPVTSDQKREIHNCVDDFEEAYSRFRANSIVQTIAKEPGLYTFPESADAIFSFYDELFALTKGKVTPLVGDTLVSAGYDAAYSLKPLSTIAQTLNYKKDIRRDGSQITTSIPLTLDIGAVGKGYMIDYVITILQDYGHKHFVVDGSGDMRVVGERVETVGLENPMNTEEAIGTLVIANGALCASANNRRAWGEWHHIIDPDTSQPVQDVIATWAIADTAMLADGLATALFFTEPQILASKYNYEYMRMFANGSIEYSALFAKGVF